MRCRLCPRMCGALRTERDGSGVCGMPEVPVVARAALHYWEEPPISGTRGSGAVFFSGCPLGCVYCQNVEISRGGFGAPVTAGRLRKLFERLIEEGAHNINLVTPTHFSHAVAEALEAPLPVPVVYNCGGYERAQTQKALAGKVQVYLPDFKYPDEEGAARYSGARDYPGVARAAICEMARQTGPCVLEGGLLTRGTMIRHLILPGRVQQAKEVMDWVAATFPPKTVLFSLMSQYTPCGPAREIPALSRALRPSEAAAARDYMQSLGLEGYVQDRSAHGEGFIPAFDLTGVF